MGICGLGQLVMTVSLPPYTQLVEHIVFMIAHIFLYYIFLVGIFCCYNACEFLTKDKINTCRFSICLRINIVKKKTKENTK